MAASTSRRNDWRYYRNLREGESLQKKLQEKHGENVKFDPAPDGIDITVVMEKFIEPYMDSADTKAGYYKLIGLAVIAWNISLLSKRRRQKEAVNEIIGKLPPDVRADSRKLLTTLLKRKRRHFAQFRQAILDYKITDTGHGFHLQVEATSKPI